jgi:flagellar motility protein MotE (MotC chaperone)
MIAVSVFIRAKNVFVLYRIIQGFTVSAAHAEDGKAAGKVKGNKVSAITQKKDAATEFSTEKKILALERKQLQQEKERLETLKKEIETKLQALKALEVKVGKLLNKRDEREEKRLEQLARVFESTPPEQAGPLFSKLEIKTAAAILYRMNGRKAGKIWGYVDADRAVKISEELTRLKEKK